MVGDAAFGRPPTWYYEGCEMSVRQCKQKHGGEPIRTNTMFPRAGGNKKSPLTNSQNNASGVVIEWSLKISEHALLCTTHKTFFPVNVHRTANVAWQTMIMRTCVRTCEVMSRSCYMRTCGKHKTWPGRGEPKRNKCGPLRNNTPQQNVRANKFAHV